MNPTHFVHSTVWAFHSSEYISPRDFSAACNNPIKFMICRYTPRMQLFVGMIEFSNQISTDRLRRAVPHIYWFDQTPGSINRLRNYFARSDPRFHPHIEYYYGEETEYFPEEFPL